MPRMKSPGYQPISHKGLSSEEYVRKLKEERDSWARAANANVACAAREHELLARREAPNDPAEAAIFYEWAEDQRERWIGIPEGADPVQVMIYYDERLQEYRAELKAEAQANQARRARQLDESRNDELEK